MTDLAQTSLEYAAAFVEEMRRSGVRNVCVSPGSRSTPLALAIASNPELKTWIHIDERCSAFFALGIARASNEPVAIVCTSGTAAANFFPAIVEARSAGVPLLVLTADRPPELRDVGAAQTIDQNRLYGAHAKWFVEVALPEPSPGMKRYVRTLASRAVAVATESPAGPVHLNFPFREPLVPSSPDAIQDAEARADGAPWVRVAKAQRELDSDSLRSLADRLARASKPLIVCGPQRDRSLGDSVTRLAQKIGAPVLADPLSQVRWGAHARDAIIDRYDAVLRHETTATALAPDLIIRIGGTPTSKALIQFIEKQTAASLVVIAESQWPDPSHLAEEMVRADARAACDQLADAVRSSRSDETWLERWKQADRVARSALEQHACSVSEPFEGAALADVAAVLPDGAALFVSSSMPVRDLDAFAAGDSRSMHVMANRGANGIDGVVSTALGAAAAADSGSPLVLVIGDLALYHDMNGLLAAKLHHIDATVVVINNDGGGIFSFLPQSQHPAHFEMLFGTPHGLDFEPVAELYGAQYERVRDSASLRRAVATSIARGGLNIVEIRTERARNVELHREAWAQVAAGLDTI
ncbi:MAG TPA: 2-succinyl-5-enolpyruvyl-6-hydroxy-3-cyclohexene-1-carboxylic-acid synthase [Gemmatimonadaceae bacterium]|nr:2-succinyl-5-enolpyruvyl-6-hydroxy-3-cyclohexene-1-carboxylic-acid synthase [Gemmatimonadaceae bacterium]